MELYIQQESIAADHALFGAQSVLQGADRRANGCSSRRASARPTISRRPPSCAPRRASTIPTSSTISCPAAVRYDGKAAAKSHGFQAHVGPMRSKSRGAVTLRSADPWHKPEIRFNYMSHPDDWTEFRHCIRLTREIFGQEAFDALSRQGDFAGRAGAERRRTRRFHPRARRKRLSPLRHLPDGPRRRSDGRGRSGMPRDRRRWLARCRFLDLPARHQRQSQRAVDHDRREGRRPHSRPRAARAVQSGTLDQSALAEATGEACSDRIPENFR